MLTLNNHFICSIVTFILSACLGTPQASQSANWSCPKLIYPNYNFSPQLQECIGRTTEGRKHKYLMVLRVY